MTLKLLGDWKKLKKREWLHAGKPKNRAGGKIRTNPYFFQMLIKPGS